MNITHDERGFTLIEVVIALGVLGFGILAMFSMQVFSIRGNSTANTITYGVEKSAEGLEQLMSMNNSDIPSDCKVEANVKLKNIESITCATTPNSPIPGMITIDVTINNNINNRKVALNFLKTNSDF